MGSAEQPTQCVSASSRTRLRSGAASVGLLALILLDPNGAHAQASAPAATVSIQADGPPRPANRQAHGPQGPDGLSHDELYLEADSVTEDQTHHLLSARGSAQARYQGATLRAKEVIYNTESGVVTANGSAQIINADGTVQYAEHMELDNKLRVGVATGFAAREDQNVKIAAAAAAQRSETVRELDRAIFTPCDVCASNGHSGQPTWSIQADKIVQDKARKLVFYRHAIIRIKGVPIFYAPVLWHPDPSAKRASGLLVPRVSISPRRGFSYDQPFLWVISPSEDLTLAPQINTKLNPFLTAEWRKQFYSGEVEARLGYTYDVTTDADGNHYGKQTSRSFVLAKGEFAIDPSWRWGFSAERTSDPTLFGRYDVSNVYANRGLYDDELGRLTTQIFTVRQDQRSFVSISAISFQSLRPWIDPNLDIGFPDPTCVAAPGTHPNRCPLITENNRAIPVVAPLIEARFEPDQTILGGRLRLIGSAVALEQEQNSLGPCQPLAPGTPITADPTCTPVVQGPGVGSRRATAQVDWRASFITGSGLRLDPFLIGRADGYSVSHAPGYTGNVAVGRGSATAGLDVSYPLIRRIANGSVLVEPIAEFAISPKANLDPRIPNEDSYAFSIDETNLFRPNHFTGFDIYEGGGRLNAGVRTTVNLDNGAWAQALIGRSLRTSENSLQAPTLSRALQSWVVAVQSGPVTGVTTFARAEIDDRARLRRAEAGINWDFARSHGFLRYFKSEGSPFIDPLDPFTVSSKGSDFEASGDVMVTRHWGAVFNVTRDIEKRLWRYSEGGIVYQDDCSRFEVVYRRNESGLLRRTDAVYLRLSLATLGDTGYRRYDDR